MAELPEPLVPAEVDLRDYEYLPLDVMRLLRSSTWRKARQQPELGYWMVNLWVSSWHEVPAASLPDDDIELAEFARCDLSRWAEVRDKVLSGWVPCSDGRLYHPVVAEKALEAWDKMRAQRKQTLAARQSKKRKLLEATKKSATKRVTSHETSEATETVASSVTDKATETVTASNGTERRGTEQNRREESPPAAASLDAAREVPAEKPQAAAAAPEGPSAAMDARSSQDAALAAWNEAADRHGLIRIDFLTSTRRFKLDRIFAICGGVEGWKAALDHAPSQAFLRTADDGWQPWFRFDWLLDEDHFAKLMEGQYADRHERSREDERSLTAAVAGALAAGSR